MSETLFAALIGTDELFEFICSKLEQPIYFGYDTWDILENELYDFTY